MDRDNRLEPFLAHLRQLPYVKALRVTSSLDPQAETRLQIRTERGIFPLQIDFRRSFLDQASTTALIGWASRAASPIILFARYIPRPTGERLAGVGINFVDQVGNVHLTLGKNYQTLLLGKPQPRREPEGRRISPAMVQVLFTYLASPKSANLPARELGRLAAIGKTAAAEVRPRLLLDGILQKTRAGTYAIADLKELEQRFLDGYARVLRPHLHLGRFRAKELDPDAFVARFAGLAEQHTVRWALTGAAGAFQLDRFYRGEETAFFVDRLRRDLLPGLSLLPDRQGPVTFLRLFGDLAVWRSTGPIPIAHPWLLYAELLNRDEPRAIEAAQEIHDKYLVHEPTHP
jgi:hypothetical protein